MSQTSLFDQPPGNGLTDFEASELAQPNVRLRDSMRRRAGDLRRARLIEFVDTVVGDVGRENMRCAITPLGVTACAKLDAGGPISVPDWHRARSTDPDTSQEAARLLKPGVDMHTLLRIYRDAAGLYS